MEERVKFCTLDQINESISVFTEYVRAYWICKKDPPRSTCTVLAGQPVPKLFAVGPYFETARTIILNSFFTDDDTRRFCGQCRPRLDCTECAV